MLSNYICNFYRIQIAPDLMLILKFDPGMLSSPTCSYPVQDLSFALTLTKRNRFWEGGLNDCCPD
jgi:hypothetical protein